MVSSPLSCHTLLFLPGVTAVMLAQVTGWSQWMTWTCKGSLIPPQSISSRTLLMMLLWWCHSPKKGFTKVKAALQAFRHVKCSLSLHTEFTYFNIHVFYPVLTESSSGYVPFQAKSALKALDSGQKQELDYDNSSEEQVRGSPSPPAHNTGTPSSSSSPVYQQTSLTSQAPRSGVTKTSPPPSNGVLQCLERAKAGTTAASVAQQHKPAPAVSLDPMPPALPPKTRKAKVSEAPKVLEHSDRGDSDMDEETYSSKQEKLKVKKVRPFCFFILLWK